MALKSQVVEDCKSDDEEIAAYVRRFKRFMKEKKPWKKNKNQFSKDELKKKFKKEFKKDSKKESSVIYYNCNKLRHVKQECKLPKKDSKYSKMKKEKAMKATWSDSDESNSEEDEEIEEMENLCLMAKENDSSSD